jgi:hypothetical protein
MRRLVQLLPVICVAYLAGVTTSEPAKSLFGADQIDASQMTLTDSLVTDFYSAWNAQSLDSMASRLQSSAFFRSPFQLRYGSDEMLATVLRRNPETFRNVTSVESHSFVSSTLAWSIGTLESDVFDSDGVRTPERFDSNYLHVFTPDERGKWRVQMLVYHEACE